MTETNEETKQQPLVADVFSEESQGTQQSPMEALRARRDERAAKTEVFIPLTDYTEMGLNVKYRLLGREEVDAITKRVRQQTKVQSEYMFRVIIDTMIASCEGFYLIAPGLGEEDAEPLTAEDSKEFIATYAQLAAELQGSPFTSHRAAVIYCFADNEFAVGQHGLLLNRWLSNTGIDIDEEFLQG